ncbi:hypothetical protein CHS0354_032414 [Potamilus streckersoni]|uniref:Uncharacterized protein n=1 Tax=Potamilus streckersoni TaxID=2493646 RepID=A0AAE0S2J7_9BIVA|nr:hypothetical protein CHS0354_032414 [Potamilus streckersoni]
MQINVLHINVSVVSRECYFLRNTITLLQLRETTNRHISINTLHLDDDDVKLKLTSLVRRFGRQDTERLFPPTVATLSTRNISAFPSRVAADVKRNLKEYYVRVAVVIDPALWDL